MIDLRWWTPRDKSKEVWFICWESDPYPSPKDTSLEAAIRRIIIYENSWKPKEYLWK